jgi:hypothetical protein
MTFLTFKDRVRGAARVGGYVSFVCFVTGLLAARSVRADVGEQSLIVGRELSGLRDLVGGTHRVSINGEPVMVAEATVSMSAREVLDRVEGLCLENANGLGAILADPANELPKATKDELSTIGVGRLGVLRTEKDGEGAIGCLAHPGDGGIRGLAERVTRFSKTLDLGDIGKLRYVYARPTKNGRTQVVTAWTDGAVRVDKIFPRDGSEPPGDDAADAPRPPNAKRLLTATVDSAPYGVRLYDADAPLSAVLSTYDEAMPKRGWRTVPEVSHDHPETRAYTREGVDLLIFAAAEGSRTSVAVIEMRAVAP